MSVKHYPHNSSKKDENRSYISKCGLNGLEWNVIAKTIGKVSCAECILQLMTDYETKIVLLEDRYQELFPDRPVGEKLQ